MGTIKSWIDPAIEKIWRENRGISDAVIVMYRERVQQFRNYCALKGLSERSELTLAGVERFSRWRARRFKGQFQFAFPLARSALGTWSCARKTLGERLPEWKSSAEPPQVLPAVVREFAHHLHHHRGNQLKTVHNKTTHVVRFLAFLRRRRRPLHEVRLSDIDRFVLHLGARYSRVYVSDFCSSLRSFTRFLRGNGKLSADLAPSILAPVRRTLERPYRALAWRDVQRILGAVDLGTRSGHRNYALLLMMSLYGLGAGEIIRIRLDDIDWRAGIIHVVRPKTGVVFTLPLLPVVARALLRYLRHGRPRHPSTRALFVTVRAPYKQLGDAATIRHILHTHAHKAGVSAPFLGTHALRHTHACRQMELGTRSKIIGDILGHRDPQSTSAYLRVSTRQLREMALPVPS